MLDTSHCAQPAWFVAVHSSRGPEPRCFKNDRATIRQRVQRVFRPPFGPKWRSHNSKAHQQKRHAKQRENDLKNPNRAALLASHDSGHCNPKNSKPRKERPEQHCGYRGHPHPKMSPASVPQHHLSGLQLTPNHVLIQITCHNVGYSKCRLARQRKRLGFNRLARGRS